MFVQQNIIKDLEKQKPSMTYFSNIHCLLLKLKKQKISEETRFDKSFRTAHECIVN